MLNFSASRYKLIFDRFPKMKNALVDFGIGHFEID